MAEFYGRVKREQIAKMRVEVEDWELEDMDDAEIRRFILDVMKEESYNLDSFHWDSWDSEVIYVDWERAGMEDV